MKQFVSDYRHEAADLGHFKSAFRSWEILACARSCGCACVRDSWSFIRSV